MLLLLLVIKVGHSFARRFEQSQHDRLCSIGVKCGHLSDIPVRTCESRLGIIAISRLTSNVLPRSSSQHPTCESLNANINLYSLKVLAEKLRDLVWQMIVEQILDSSQHKRRQMRIMNSSRLLIDQLDELVADNRPSFGCQASLTQKFSSLKELSFAYSDWRRANSFEFCRNQIWREVNIHAKRAAETTGNSRGWPTKVCTICCVIVSRTTKPRTGTEFASRDPSMSRSSDCGRPLWWPQWLNIIYLPASLPSASSQLLFAAPKPLAATSLTFFDGSSLCCCCLVD